MLLPARRKSHQFLLSSPGKPRDCTRRHHLRRLLLLLLSLEILVGEVGGGTTDEHDGVHADAEARGIARRCGGGDGAGLGCLGGRVAGLL